MQREGAGDLVRDCATSREEAPWRRFVGSFEDRIRMAVLHAFFRVGATPRWHTVDELVQDVYCRLLEHDRRILRECRARSESSVMGYLASVCTSVVVDHLRAQATQKRGGRTLVVRPVADGVRDHLEWIADPAAGPEQRYLLREARLEFLDSCSLVFAGDLRERNLEIFRLAFVEGWTSREISVRFDGTIKPGSIDSVIHRHRRLLQERGVAVPER